MALTAHMIRILFFGLGLFLLGYLLFQLGPRMIASMLVGVGWNFFWIVLIYAIHQLVRAAALWQCLPVAELRNYRDMVQIRLSGEAIQYLTFTGPFVAEPTKAWLLRKQGLTGAEAFAATITEYLIYNFAAAGIALAGLTYILSHFDLPAATSIALRVMVYAMAGFLAVSAIAITFRIHLIGNIVRGVASLPIIRNRFRPNHSDVRHIENLLLGVLRERPVKFVTIFAIETAAHALLVLEMYWILTSIGISFPIVDPFLIEAATKFIGLACFFVPLQVGATEGTYALIFEILGIAGAVGFAAAFLRRLRMLLVSCIGLVALFNLTGPKSGTNLPPA